MRNGQHLLALAALLGSSTALSAGCIDLLAEYYDPLTNAALFDGGSDADGGGGGIPAGCDPAQNKDAVADTCGAFVSPTGNDDTGKGTKASPFKSFKKALEKKGTIYACAGATTFTEEVVLDRKATLFGGLDCGTWEYDAASRTKLTAGEDQIPLKLTSAAGGSAIENFEITAKDATIDGGSSIAVLDDGADLDITRCEITAGKGANGAVGATPPGSGQTGANAPEPTPVGALDGCVMNVNGVFGGQPGQSTCGSDETSGGSGGNGQNQSIGGVAADAQPQPQPNATTGFDGKAGKPQDALACLPGNPGAPGLHGSMPGAGATSIGDISTSGYQAPAATAGQSPGSPGYGGGGGGGAKKCANGFAGPAGGGGGAGGCGGLPGGGGQSAGSSFAIVALNATVSLDTVTITTADGGDGGAGGDGQPGGQGGKGGSAGDSGGDGSVSACDGGKGGQGGRGSSGGGGLGGHSAGIAFKGKAPVQVGVTTTHGKGGGGGIGGDMDATSQGIVGGGGLGCKTLDFTTPASPSACVK